MIVTLSKSLVCFPRSLARDGGIRCNMLKPCSHTAMASCHIVSAVLIESCRERQYTVHLIRLKAHRDSVCSTLAALQNGCVAALTGNDADGLGSRSHIVREVAGLVQHDAERWQNSSEKRPPPTAKASAIMTPVPTSQRVRCELM